MRPGHDMRHMPVIRLMRDIVAHGEIGESVAASLRRWLCGWPRA
ncbi:hypothetical protein [Streptomyces sp. NPDC057623]